MSKRLTTTCAILAVLAAACATQPHPVVDYGAGTRFVPQVVDSLDDVGIGSSIAVTADGVPYVSYLGFPAVVKEGEISTQRPVGSAFLPAVLLSDMNTDGVWNRGALVQAKPDSEPNGVTVPFGPQTVAKLGLTKGNTNGTAVAVGDDGTVHVAWTQADGVWYASTKDGGASTTSQVFDYGTGVSLAGSIGRPGIALDDSGHPWVAFAVKAAKGIEVRVATPTGNGWKVVTVATGTTCDGCPQPGPAAIANVGGKPVVAFADPGGSRIVIATSDGTTWTTQDVHATKDVSGLSMSAAAGDAVAAYYAGGKLEVATDAGGGWQATEVATADLGKVATARGNLAPTTGVAGGKDVTFVAWQDTAGVHLASGSGDSFEQIDTTATQGGTSPSLAVDADGNAYVAWYDPTNGNLMLGIYGDLSGVAVANPSPSLQVAVGGAGAECGKDKTIQLDILAKGTAFDPTCLVAAPAKPFTINFDDQDDAATIGQHNIAIFESAADATDLPSALFTGDLVTGPAQVTYDVQVLLDPGSYFFHCNVHPTMTGTLAVVAGAK